MRRREEDIIGLALRPHTKIIINLKTENIEFVRFPGSAVPDFRDFGLNSKCTLVLKLTLKSLAYFLSLEMRKGNPIG